MPDQKTPTIAEKVRFWEEQDKINQALIPRVLEMHEALLDLNTRTADISGQIAAAEARVYQQVQLKLQETALSQRGRPASTAAPKVGEVRLVAYAALVLAILACVLSIYPLLS